MARRDVIEQSGRTVDDAVQAALRQLGLTRAQVEVTVLEEGRQGILGVGGTQARVRVTPREGAQASSSGAPASLPRIDDYDDLAEVEPGDRGGDRSGRRSGSRRSSRRVVQPSDEAASASSGALVSPADAESQHEVQPDHRSRSRRQAVGSAGSREGGRSERGRSGGRPRGRSDRRDEPRERPPAREPIGPFELLADPEFEPNEDARQFAVELLTDITHLLGFEVEVVARDPESPLEGVGHAQSVLDVRPIGDDDLGLLIGRHGSHVQALQYVVNVIVGRALDGDHPVTVDIDGYRRRREEALIEMAQRAADEVREHGEPVTLGTMPPAERRIIHLQLQDDPELRTESFGEGQTRRVRILYRDE